MRLAAAVLLVILTLGACGRPDSSAGTGGDDRSSPGGTLVVATPADVDFLLPQLYTGIQGRQLTDLLFDRLAEIGDSLNTVGDAGFAPRLASAWRWAPDSLSIAFQVDPRARWHDGVPIRAADVAFSYRLYADPAVGSAIAPLLAGIDSVTATDSLTAVVWYKRRSPQQFFDAVYQLVIIPEHVYGGIRPADLRASPVVRQPVGSGRFRFARWVPGSTLELVSDTANWRGRALLDRVVFSIAPDFASAPLKLFAGEADFFEMLRAQDVTELAKHPDLKLVPYPSLAYGSLTFNLRDPKRPGRAHPVLGDRAVRRALSMAVDRQAIVRNVFDSLAYVARGPFVRATGGGIQVTELPFDRDGARRLLDSLGWTARGGDGVRMREGRMLAFTMLAPTSSAVRQRMAVLLQQQLSEIGAKVDIESVEFNAFLEKQRRRTFDAIFATWNVDPTPGSIRQTWSSAGIRSDEGSNFGSYSNPVFDALVDSGAAQMKPDAARGYFQRAYQTILDDAPAIWLYEPRFFAGAQKRLRLTGLRADGWWVKLPDWYIPAGERTARDSLGLTPRPR